MGCQVKRDRDDEIMEVLAANGNRSIAYDTILDKVKSITGEERSKLENRYRDWVGKHINNINDNKELALALYKQLYSPNFKNWYGDWRGGIGNLDENGEPKITDGVFTNGEGDKKDITNHGTFSPYSNDKMWQLEGNTNPSKAPAGTIKKVQDFLERAGVNVQEVKSIAGGASGLADSIYGLVQYVEGKKDTTLPEEAMHIAVDLIQQKDPALFKEMMNKIGSYRVFNDVVDQYRGNKLYQKDGKPDIPKLKKETIGKVLAQTIIDKNEGTQEKPEMFAQTKNWWQKIIDFLKKLFLSSKMNPFEKAGEDILSEKDYGKVGDLADTLDGTFLQTEKGRELNAKLVDNNNNIVKTGDKYEINGEKIRHTVDEKALEVIKRRYRDKPVNETTRIAREYKRETENKGKDDIGDILDRYIGNDNELKASPDSQTNPSSVSPTDNTFYATLEAGVKDLISGYETGTKFYRGINVYDPKTSTAGTIDLLAITPSDKVNILQFKIPDTGKPGGKDIPLPRQEAYNVEVEGLRQILQGGYGIKREQFNQTRVIPIKAEYQYMHPGDYTSGLVLVKMSIGNKDVRLIKDDFLLPIPSHSETTGNKKFDAYIDRLRGLVSKLQAEKPIPGREHERTTRIISVLNSIRKLQVQGQAEQLLNSGRLIIDRQKEIYKQLSDKMQKLDPKASTLEELRDIATGIISEKDEMALYKDLYPVMRAVFGDDKETVETLKKARDVSDDAQILGDNYENMLVDLISNKFAGRFDINDEFNPEKEMNFWQSTIRSASQGKTKGSIYLWKLFERIDHPYQLLFQDRKAEVDKMFKDIKDSGKTEKQIENSLLQMDGDGKWTGRFKQKYDKEFYGNLRKAQETGDLKWIKDNIDVKEYSKWYADKLKDIQDRHAIERKHIDAQIDAKIKTEELADFKRRFSLAASSGVNLTNYKLSDFPKDKWESSDYKDLQRPGNESLLKVWNYWRDFLDRGVENGMIEGHRGYSVFPHINKHGIERLIAGHGFGFLDSITVHGDDDYSTEIDPLTGKQINRIHARFFNDLARNVKQPDGTYKKDTSKLSTDVHNNILLGVREMLRFELRDQTEDLAKAILLVEKLRLMFKTNWRGNIRRNKLTGEPIAPVENVENYNYLVKHMEAIFYNKTNIGSDYTFQIPVKQVVERINKTFGAHLHVPEQETHLSLSKFVDGLNNFYRMKTLGLALIPGGAHIIGGTINTFINKGIFIDGKDILQSEADFASGFFWKDERMKKQAALLAYFHPFVTDTTTEDINRMSASKAASFFSSDKLFVLIQKADHWVNAIIGLSFIKNTVVIDGKLVNAKAQARKELGLGMYNKGAKEAIEVQKQIDARSKELKNGPTSLINIATITNDQINIPGIDRTSDTVIQLRQAMLNFIKDTLGTVSSSDMAIWRMSVIGRSVGLFKGWIPRLIDVRFQSPRIDAGSGTLQWGRVRVFGDFFMKTGVKSIGSLIGMLSGNPNDTVIDAAKKAFKEQQEKASNEKEDFPINEEEFIKTYIDSVRKEFKELSLALGFMALLVLAKLNSPDKEEGDTKKGLYKWMLKGIDKAEERVSFFYNPQSFTDIANGSIFASVGLLVELQKFLVKGISKTYYEMIGDDKAAENIKLSKNVFKMLPITKELVNYFAIFDHDIAKEFGLQVSSSNGSTK